MDDPFLMGFWIGLGLMAGMNVYLVLHVFIVRLLRVLK